MQHKQASKLASAHAWHSCSRPPHTHMSSWLHCLTPCLVSWCVHALLAQCFCHHRSCRVCRVALHRPGSWRQGTAGGADWLHPNHSQAATGCSRMVTPCPAPSWWCRVGTCADNTIRHASASATSSASDACRMFGCTAGEHALGARVGVAAGRPPALGADHGAPSSVPKARLWKARAYVLKSHACRCWDRG